MLRNRLRKRLRQEINTKFLACQVELLKFRNPRISKFWGLFAYYDKTTATSAAKIPAPLQSSIPGLYSIWRKQWVVTRLVGTKGSVGIL